MHFSKVYFCKVYPAYASSKLFELIPTMHLSAHKTSYLPANYNYCSIAVPSIRGPWCPWCLPCACVQACLIMTTIMGICQSIGILFHRRALHDTHPRCLCRLLSIIGQHFQALLGSRGYVSTPVHAPPPMPSCNVADRSLAGAPEAAPRGSSLVEVVPNL